MPYKIYKVQGGYKVGKADGTKMSNGRMYLSNKPRCIKDATAQLKAVEENEKKNKSISKKNAVLPKKRKQPRGMGTNQRRNNGSTRRNIKSNDKY